YPDFPCRMPDDPATPAPHPTPAAAPSPAAAADATPVAEVGMGGLTPSQVGRLLQAGSGLFDSGADGPVRAWEPPPVEWLRRALPQLEITEFLARGGMGAVYQGRQRALGRPVAIKVLPPELHGSWARDRDADEGDGQESKLLYFVMEFIEGTDVGQLIAAEGRLAPERAAWIAVAVCDALAYAHEAGIVHRDIKPSNVLIDPSGRVKVADFGLAKAFDLESSVVTQSNLALGSPDFAAPEILLPGTTVDGRADLYAVGVMLYQMLTGQIPRGRFELPGSLMPQLGTRFDAILDRALQADPGKRYATAAELKRDLERAVPPDGCAAEPPSPAVSISRPRVWRAPVVVAGAAILLVAGGLMLKSGMERNNGKPVPAAHEGPAAEARPVAAGVAYPVIGPDGKVQFPIGVWARIQTRDKEAGRLANPENQRDGGWERLQDVALAGGYERNCTLMTNQGLRARFRGQRTGVDYPQMQLRGLEGKTPHYNLHIRFGKIQIRLSPSSPPSA
ncbi:MAG: serine/threonine protein kinase, partial [Akkermansiaceae bacterium]|nr:serine/threonine protein kinase [Akkermansiaceae bacterium]